MMEVLGSSETIHNPDCSASNDKLIGSAKLVGQKEGDMTSSDTLS
jgi:hypothetical protein